jgi:adenine deaminase
MLIPSEFARVAVIHGTVAAVSDPHEIANVLGIDGVKYMIENGKTIPMKFYFGAPSCVPASTFETSGASIGPEELEELLKLEEIKYLGEVMNFPGVLSGDSILDKKISIAKKYSKLIDGHAPGLRGKGLMQYIDAGITTDHECLTKDEALEKIRLGMKVQIREGSAAKNAKDLMSIIDEHCEDCMFCSDDKHPDDLVKGHINDLVKMALNSGIDMMKVLTVACVNPVLHYKLDVGILQKGDSGDFLLVDNLHNFKILSTYINGQIVAEEGKSLINKVPSTILNNFNVGKKKKVDFALPRNKGNINVIEAIDGGLITNKLILIPRIVNGYAVSDVERDILKIAVVNRYSEEEVAIGFIKNFGLKKGAIASSVAHDSHNVIAVGVTDEDICRAVNLIIENKGGISAISEEKEMVLPLPIAGIMSNEDYSEVVNKYGAIDNMAKSLGSTLHAPFMTLSFMALLVIPKIKLSDMGLFDSEKFQFINIFEKQ